MAVDSITPRGRTIIKQNERMIEDLKAQLTSVREDIDAWQIKWKELTSIAGRLDSAIGMLEAANVAVQMLIDDDSVESVETTPTSYVGGNFPHTGTFEDRIPESEIAEASRYAQADGFEESPAKVTEGNENEPDVPRDDAFDYGPPPVNDDDVPF